MTEEHQSVNQVRTDETSTTGDCQGQLKFTTFELNRDEDVLRILFRSALGKSLTGGNLATVVY